MKKKAIIARTLGELYFDSAILTDLGKIRIHSTSSLLAVWRLNASVAFSSFILSECRARAQLRPYVGELRCSCVIHQRWHVASTDAPGIDHVNERGGCPGVQKVRCESTRNICWHPTSIGGLSRPRSFFPRSTISVWDSRSDYTTSCTTSSGSPGRHDPGMS